MIQHSDDSTRDVPKYSHTLSAFIPTGRHVAESTDCVTGTEPSAVTDLDLVRLAQAGDVEAFGELVERNRRAVFRAALACVGSPAEADDVAQEAFVTAFRKLGTFRGEAQFRTWLLSITWRKAIDRRKSASRWLRLTFAPPRDDSGEDAFDYMERIPSMARSQEEVGRRRGTAAERHAADRHAAEEAARRAPSGGNRGAYIRADQQDAGGAARHREVESLGGAARAQEEAGCSRICL